MIHIPWYMRSTSTSNPFSTTGIDWCPRCKLQVDTDTAAEHQGTTFTFKKWCRRCGRVICAGIYDSVAILSDRPLPPAALEWTWQGGKDKR